MDGLSNSDVALLSRDGDSLPLLSLKSDAQIQNKLEVLNGS